MYNVQLVPQKQVSLSKELRIFLWCYYLDDKILFCVLCNRELARRAQLQNLLVFWKGGSTISHRGIALSQLILLFVSRRCWCPAYTPMPKQSPFTPHLYPPHQLCLSVNISLRPCQHITSFSLSVLIEHQASKVSSWQISTKIQQSIAFVEYIMKKEEDLSGWQPVMVVGRWWIVMPLTP